MPAPQAFWTGLAWRICAPLLGAAAACWGTTALLIPKIGLGDATRVVALGQRLDQGFHEKPTAVFVGNSVTQEGIDAAVVEKAAPSGWHCENLAVPGCDLYELRMLLPRVLAAKPRAVCLGYSPTMLYGAADVAVDKANAYAYAGFPQYWPKEWRRNDFPGVSQASFDRLESHRLQQYIYFRTRPGNWLNNESRRGMRKDLRTDYYDDWTAPFQLLETGVDLKNAYQIETYRNNLKNLISAKDEPTAALLLAMAKDVQQAGSQPILIMLPLFPVGEEITSSLAQRLKERLEIISQDTGGVVIDAHNLLSADEFADTAHPNAAGRKKYSQYVGERLPPSSEAHATQVSP